MKSNLYALFVIKTLCRIVSRLLNINVHIKLVTPNVFPPNWYFLSIKQITAYLITSKLFFYLISLMPQPYLYSSDRKSDYIHIPAFHYLFFARALNNRLKGLITQKTFFLSFLPFKGRKYKNLLHYILTGKYRRNLHLDLNQP